MKVMSEIVLNDEFDLKEQRFISLNAKKVIQQNSRTEKIKHKNLI